MPDLTKQQAHIMREFGRPDDPFEQSSETISICGVREWPTCDNLVKLGLISRAYWDAQRGYHYRITKAGVTVLRELR